MVGTINYYKLYDVVIEKQNPIISGNIGLTQLRERREEITRRWERVGLLVGLTGNIKENVAELFESQLSYAIRPDDQQVNDNLNVAVVFPQIRRVFAPLVLNEMIGIDYNSMEEKLYENELSEYLDLIY